MTNLGSTLLGTTKDDKLLLIFGIIQQYLFILNISQIFQNKMCFPLLHYTSKNEEKGHECHEKVDKFFKINLKKKP
jgi:hypothetical protein